MILKKALIVFVLFLPFELFAQKGNIDTLYVTDIVERNPIMVIDEGFGEGPLIYGKCTIYNDQTDTLLCHSRTYFTFKRDTTTVESLPVFMDMSIESIAVPPKQSYTFSFGVPLLFHLFHNKTTSADGKEQIWDHSDILREIQSTLVLHVATNDHVIEVSPANIVWKENNH